MNNYSLPKAFKMWVPTFGGKQFWTDHRWLYGWRVQFNSTIQRWRLIKPNGFLVIQGDRQKVVSHFETLRPSIEGSSIPPKHCVILIHGLMRTATSMSSLARAFVKETDIAPIAVSYASTRDPINIHAGALKELLCHLPGKPQLSFACHSLGNIVLRYLLGGLMAAEDETGLLARMSRVVMLGPPNNGSSLAKRLSELKLFELVTGRTGLDLGRSWENLESKLATPPCPFGIIAGDVSQSKWTLPNPFVVGPSDWIVKVEETELEGAADRLILPCLHSFLMTNPEAVAATLRFMQDGTFR